MNQQIEMWVNLPSRFLLAGALAILSGCGNLPARLDAGINSANSTLTIRLAGALIVGETSVLNGSSAADLPRLAYERTRAGVALRVYCDEPYCDAAFMDRFADSIAAVPGAVLYFTGVDPKVGAITILLIPPDRRYRQQSFSWAATGDLHLDFALRADVDPEVSLLGAVRTVSHEITHVAVAWSGATVSAEVNEGAAYSMEPCAQLRILGRAKRWDNSEPARDGFEQAFKGQIQPLIVSAQQRYRADLEMDELFAAGDVRADEQQRARAVRGLCMKRLRAAIPNAPDRR